LATTHAINDLPESQSLRAIVLSEEGVRLLEPGDVVDGEVKNELVELGFERVVIADSDRDAEGFIQSVRYEQRALENVGVKERIASPIYDRQERLLVQAGAFLNDQTRLVLDRQGIEKVYVLKPIAEDIEARNGRFLMRVQEMRQKWTAEMKYTFKLPPKQEIPKERMIEDPSSITVDSVNEQIDAATEEELLERPSGPPLSDQIKKNDPMELRPAGQILKVLQVHENVLRDAEQIFAQVRAKKKIPGELVSALANNVVLGLINDASMSLNLSGMENSPHYYVSHAINTVLLSIHIASRLGYSAKQVHELCYGALLHDIGVMRVSSEVLGKKGPADAQELRQIQQHPVFGVDALQQISGLPKTAPMVVYQSHERLDGSGYPRGRKKSRIHSYAQIVSIAAVYDAMKTDRPYRQAMHPYFAMENVLKLVGLKQFDAEVARALLEAISLFPIGCWVDLDNGAKGRVVGANADNYTRPVVSIIVNPDGEQREEPLPIDLLAKENSNVSISGPCTPPTNLSGDLRTLGF